jgi:hypothetical protein
VFNVTLIEGGKCAKICDNLCPIYLLHSALCLNHNVEADAAIKNLGSKRI